MSTKTLIAILLAIGLSFILVMIAFFGIYKYAPSLLGIKPPHKIDTLAAKKAAIKKKQPPVYIEPTVNLKKSLFDNYQRELIQKALLKHQSESLYAQQAKLIDSIKKVHESYAFIRDTIDKINKNLKQNKVEYSALTDSLAKLNSLYTVAVNEKKLVEEKIKVQEKLLESKYDSLEITNFKAFAKIYENSSPTEVAKILEKIDKEDAAFILKFMQKRKAGKILDAMSAENAAEILKLGALK